MRLLASLLPARQRRVNCRHVRSTIQDERAGPSADSSGTVLSAPGMQVKTFHSGTSLHCCAYNLRIVSHAARSPSFGFSPKTLRPIKFLISQGIAPLCSFRVGLQPLLHTLLERYLASNLCFSPRSDASRVSSVRCGQAEPPPAATGAARVTYPTCCFASLGQPDVPTFELYRGPDTFRDLSIVPDSGISVAAVSSRLTFALDVVPQSHGDVN
jgi:hypothetical protein